MRVPLPVFDMFAQPWNITAPQRKTKRYFFMIDK
jgi:hypothetical protein